jgi:cysteine dioxygenase
VATQIEHSETSPEEGCKTNNTGSLAQFVAALEAQTSHPSQEQLYGLVKSANFSEADLRPYIGFKAGNYARHRVFRNQWVEMLVLCWQPGHRTPIHDHNGSHGAVLVQQGVVWETIFTFDDVNGLAYQSSQEYGAGMITGADVPDIHQLGNPDVSNQNLITIHIYAPPLGVLHTYKPGSAKIDLYTPDESEG